MKIRKKLSMSLLAIGFLGLSSAALAQGPVVVGRPYYGGYGYGYGGYYPPPGPVPYGGYVPVAPGYSVGYPGYYSPNPALQMPLSPANPANLNRYMNGQVIPRGSVAPNPLFYNGGADYYLY